MGFEISKMVPKGFEFDEDLIDQYEATRNFPSKDSTSRLGVHLRFGTKALGNWSQKVLKEKIELFKGTDMEEFFMQILTAFSLHRKSMF